MTFTQIGVPKGNIHEICIVISRDWVTISRVFCLTLALLLKWKPMTNTCKFSALNSCNMQQPQKHICNYIWNLTFFIYPMLSFLKQWYIDFGNYCTRETIKWLFIFIIFIFLLNKEYHSDMDLNEAVRFYNIYYKKDHKLEIIENCYKWQILENCRVKLYFENVSNQHHTCVLICINCVLLIV